MTEYKHKYSSPFVSFHVPGVPVPQGSKRLVGGIKSHARLLDANAEKLKPWRATVTAAAIDARTSGQPDELWQFPLHGPVAVVIYFWMPRPKAHYNSKGQLKQPWNPESWHAKRPDLDKLVRAILDALTDADIFVDDSQVTSLLAQKNFITTDEVAADKDGQRLKDYFNSYIYHDSNHPGVGIEVRQLGGTGK